MRTLTKKCLIIAVAVLSALCLTAGIVLGTVKPVKADGVLTVTGVERIKIEGYNSNPGGFHTEYIFTFGEDVFAGYANNADLTSDFPELGSKIYHNTSNGSTAVTLGDIPNYSAVKYADNAAKISVGTYCGYAKITFQAGLTLGTYSLPAEKILYINEYWTSTETQPEYRPISIFQVADGSCFRLEIAFTRNETYNKAKFDTALLNDVATGTYTTNYWGNWRSGAYTTSVGYGLPIKIDGVTNTYNYLNNNGGVLIFPTGFGGTNGTTTKYYGFATEAGANHSWDGASSTRWKPINGFADVAVSYVGTDGDYTYKLTLTNKKDLEKNATAADLIANFNNGDDMTDFMSKFSSLSSQMRVDGTLLSSIAGVTFEKGDANEILMTLPYRADGITLAANAVAGNAYIANAVNWTDTSITAMSVTSAVMAEREPYNGNAGGIHVDYVITLNGGTNIFTQAKGTEITALYDFDGLVKINGVKISAAAGTAKVFVENANSIRLRYNKPLGYVKLTLTAGIRFGDYKLASDVNLYQNVDGTFTVGGEAPANRVNAVFERPYGSDSAVTQWELSMTCKGVGSDSRAPFQSVTYNSTPLIAGDGTTPNLPAIATSGGFYGNDYDAGNQLMTYHLYFNKAALADGGILVFNSGFNPKGSGAISATQAFANPYQYATYRASWNTYNKLVWIPVYGYSEIEFTKYSNAEVSATFTNKTLSGSADSTDMFSEFAVGDDMTTYAKAAVGLKDIQVNGTALASADVTVRKGAVNSIIINIADVSSGVSVSFHEKQVVGDMWVAERAELEFDAPGLTIGYKDGEGKLYADNAEGRTAVKIDFSITNGVYFRLATVTGLRYVCKILTDDLSEGYIVEYGTLISTTETLGAKALTFDDIEDGKNALVIVSTVHYTAGDYTAFNGVVSNIKTTNYLKHFIGRGYVKVEYEDGTFAYFYTDTVTRTPKAVATSVKENYDLSGYPAEIRAIVDAMADAE